MKKGKLFWGLGLILLAVVLILDAFGVMASFTSSIGEISLLSVLLGVLLLAFAVTRVICGRIGEIFVPLALIFMLFEENISFLCGQTTPNLINNWLLLCCAVLLWIGFSILFPGRREKWLRSHLHGKNDREKQADGKHGHTFSASVEASSVRYIDASDLVSQYIENNLGSTVVRFENVDQYTGGGELHVENNLGSTVIEVPSSWRFAEQIDNSLGSVSSDRVQAEPNAPLLTITGDNNLGSVQIKVV